MRLRNLRSQWSSLFNSSTSSRRPIRRAGLSLERLDSRDLPTITFSPIIDYTFPAGKDLLVPLTAVDSGNQAITYSALSNDPQVAATVHNNSTSLKLHVKGTDGDGNAFAGDIVLRLFGDIAPLATAQITTLANNGFYNGKLFHRVIDGFMAQGGSANGSGSGSSGQGTFDDEFNAATTFVSPGIVALANAGDDGNDSQFFIVDTDLGLANLPQHLNFNHSIVGLLVSGFDTFSKIMGVDVEAQSIFNPELSKPNPNVVIETASIISDDQNGVLRISASGGFRGATTITVTANNAGDTQQRSFTVTGVADTINDRAFLNAMPDMTTSPGSSVTFDLPATDLDNDPLNFVVRSATDFNSLPANVQVTINQFTRKATVTPLAGFTGSVDLLVGVRDQTNRGLQNLNDRGNFDTELVTLTVVDEIDLDAASDTGLYNDDNLTNDSTPDLTLHAAAGNTVTVTVSGQNFFATETGAGVYKLALPTGILKVGDNVITARVGGANPRDLAPLTINYAPTITGIYVVPGAPGSAQQLTFGMPGSESAFNNEVCFFVVDDAAGRIGALLPGNDGYSQAAIARAQSIFATTQAIGASKTVAVQGGQFLAFFIVQNATLATLRANNPSNASNRTVQAFFSIKALNNDGVEHTAIATDSAGGRMLIGFEDLTGGGDFDYNDRVASIRLTGDTGPLPTLRAPTGPARSVAANFVKMNAAKPPLSGGTAAAVGEVGFFVVDDDAGRIGLLLPNDPGYAAAALARRQQIFAAGALTGATGNATIPGGATLGFYVIDTGTASGLLAQNPANDVNGSVHAFFSFDDANPDDANHIRLFGPEMVSRAEPTADGPLLVHGMTTLNGGTSSFDDLLFSVAFVSI